METLDLKVLDLAREMLGLTLLIAGPLLASLSSTHNGSTSAPLTAAVPPQFGLLCLSWAAQATVTGGGFVDLSSAVSGVTGTQ